MITIDITDNAAFNEMLATIAHIQGGAMEAASKAINQTLRDVRKKAVKLAQATYTARAADLARKATLDLAKRGRLSGVLRIADKRGMNLVNFQATPNKPGIRPPEGATVKVLRTGGRKAPRRHGKKAFVATGRSGNTLMFVRTKQGQGGLEALYGPHPIQALSREESMVSVREAAERSLTVNIQNQVDAVLRKRTKKVRP